MIDLLVDPLRAYPFFVTALLASLAVGIGAAVLSCLLVVRHQALVGDAISHSVLLGVAVGFVVAGSVGVLPGALLAAIGTAVLTTAIERRTPLARDAVLGIVFSTAFAGGLAIISVARPVGIDLFHVLLGNVLGVGRGELVLTAATTVVVLALVVIAFRPLRLWAYDPQTAATLGVDVAALEYLFAVLLSAMVVASLQAVGLILVMAMLVIPGATARLVTDRLSRMMLVAAAVGALSAVAGLYTSFHLDVASGPAMVLAAAACFALGFIAHLVSGRPTPQAKDHTTGAVG
ncbi:MAG TPA: metal ABC transporter permease [Euzebya sp.]|nr:metal ABC transporter permease [Euzebya sp.]